MRLQVAIAGLIVGTMLSATETKAEELFQPSTNWIKSFSSQSADKDVENTVFRFQNLDAPPTEQLVSYESLGNQCAANNCEQSCVSCGECCDDGLAVGALLDLGLDTFTARTDNGRGGHQGGHVGVNVAADVWNGVGVQAGWSTGVYDWNGRTGSSPNSTYTTSTQTFFTLGVFQRCDLANCRNISWGFAYDWMLYEHPGNLAAGAITVSQWRYQIAYALNCQNEIGFRGTQHDNGAGVDASFGPGGNNWYRAINHWDLFFHHAFCNGAHASVFIGIPESDSLGLSSNAAPAINGATIDWMFGGNVTAPITNNIDVYFNYMYANGAGNTSGFAFSANQDEFYALTAGLTVYLGAERSCTVCTPAGTPYMGMANNQNFLVDFARQP